jgi:hypothetical protein
MHIEMWPIGRVVPHKKNPRINAGAVEAVAKSIPNSARGNRSSSTLATPWPAARMLADVRDAAGHANVSITSGYLHVAVDDEAEVGSLFDGSNQRQI